MIWYLVMKISINFFFKLCYVCDNLKFCFCMFVFKIYRVNKWKCISVEYLILINICICLIKIDVIFIFILFSILFVLSVWVIRFFSLVFLFVDMIVYYGYVLCVCLLVRCVFKLFYLLIYNIFYWNWWGLF